jgi:starch-binding outer membrane protein, SusD/RagB family
MSSYMTIRTSTSWIRRAALTASLSAAALACRPTDVLDVTDPDIINPADVQSAAGANAVRIGSIGRLNSATSGGSGSSEGLFLLSGLFADEWINGDSFIARQEVDQRVITVSNTFLTDVDRMLQRARLGAEQAAQLLKKYNPSGPPADVAEMYFIQAYVENVIGEHYCNGLVFSDVVDGAEIYGVPITTTAAFTLALAHADSGLALITGSTAADVKIRNVLNVTRGRILTNLGRQSDAATAVANVPTSFNYFNLHSQTTNDNAIWTYNNVARRYTISNNEGTNGLNFATANDPRIPSCIGGDATCVKAGVTLKTRDDLAQPLNVQLIWPTRDASIAIASGIEARMLEAEAAYKAGNYTLFVQKLNQARTEGAVAGLAATLTDPGTNVARENLLFRERAFWLFGRGYRVGDMRRLIRQYNRPATSVFPTGAWHKAGNYGPDVNFPVPQAEANNPNVSASNTCIDRNA